MKIIIVGGTGTIGQAVAQELGQRHEIIRVGRRGGDIQVDITDLSSIQAMYDKMGDFDALVATTGQVRFMPLSDLKPEHYQFGFNHKLMGQVNLVRLGLASIQAGGSFTLTSGILNHDPIRTSASAAMVNGALEGFVRAAALEMPNQVRINIVSPTVLLESMDKYATYFRGYEPAPAARVALAYSKSVEGAQTGQIYKIW